MRCASDRVRRRACVCVGALAAVAGFTVGLAGSSGVASADDYGYYNNDNDLLWGVTHMPDFDQKRAATPPFIDGLPGDGSMYCVPTATMNVFAYIARHGYPNFDPGVSPWSSSDMGVYNDATSNLALLGALMGTGASSGTGTSGWSFGTFLWLASEGELGRFDTYTRLAKEGQNVTTRRMAKTGLNGGIVLACYGRWNHSSDIVLTSRSGGHCITPTRVDTTGTFLSELRYRDPGSGGPSEFSQSAFATTTQNMVDQVFIAYGVPMILSKMDIQPAPSDGRFRIIDKYYTVFPKQGLTDLPVPGKIKLMTPTPLTPDFAREQEIDVIGGQIVGLAQAPSRNFWAYVAAGDATHAPGVYHVDPLTGVSIGVGELHLAKGCAFGRDERLYALDRDRIKCFKPNDDDLLMPEVEIPIPLPHSGPLGITFDDLTDEIVVVTDGTSSVLRFRQGLLLPAVQTMSGVPLNDFKGMQVHPATGHLWMLCDGSVRELVPDPMAPTRLRPGQVYSPPAGQALRSFSFDSEGHLFANLGGLVTELAPVIGAGFQPVAGSPFNGMEAGNHFVIAQSRTNFDPMIHDDPGWNTDIPAEELLVFASTPDCAADWNASDQVDVFDLLAYLDDWFAGSVEADLTGDQTTDVFDLLAYLDLWFVGC